MTGCRAGIEPGPKKIFENSGGESIPLVLTSYLMAVDASGFGCLGTS